MKPSHFHCIKNGLSSSGPLILSNRAPEGGTENELQNTSLSGCEWLQKCPGARRRLPESKGGDAEGSKTAEAGQETGLLQNTRCETQRQQEGDKQGDDLLILRNIIHSGKEIN